MGDLRFVHHYDAIRDSADPVAAIRALEDEGVVSALAHASRVRDPYLANVLATEAMNRMRRKSAVVEAAGDCLVTLDREGHVTYANRSARDVLAGGLGGRADSEGDADLPERLPFLDGVLEAVLREGRVVRGYSTRYERPDGDVLAIQASASPISHGEEVEGVVVAFADVTDRERESRRVEESEARYRALFEQHPDAVFSVDIDGNFLAVNEAGERLSGYSPEELVGTPFLPLLAPEDRERVLEDFFRVLGGAPQRSTLALIRKDGNRVRLEVDAVPIAVGDAIVGAHCVAREAEAPPAVGVDGILGTVTDGIVAVDRDWRLTYVNAQAERMLGRSRFDILGRDAVALFGDDNPRMEQYRRAMEEREPVTMEAQFSTGSWFEIHVQPTKDGGLAVLFRDVTARKRAEDALQESETRFREFAEHMDTVLWMTEAASHRVIYVNPAYERVWGRPREELYRHPLVWLDAVHPEDRDRIHAANAKLSSDGASFEEEYRVVRPDGEVRWIHDCGFRVPDDEGRPPVIAGLAEDVTERRSLEAAARSHSENLSFVADASRAFTEAGLDFDRLLDTVARVVATRIGDTCGIRLLSPDGERIIPAALHQAVPGPANATEAFFRIPQRADDGWTGRVLRTGEPLFIPHANAASFLEGMSPQYRKSVEGVPFESVMIVPLRVGSRTLGALILVRLRPDRPYREEDLDLVQSVADRAAVVIDHARLFEAEREAREHAEAARREVRALNDDLERHVSQRTRELKAANEELEAFSYSVSHDLRAPLRGIEYFGQVLQDEYAHHLDAEGRAYLTRVLAESKRLTTLVNDLLTLSRATRGDLKREQVDLSEVARSVVADLERRDPGRDVDVVIEDGLTANGDARLLRVVLENLIGNAWKFTAKTPAARIEFEATEDRTGRSVYAVRDNGAGFDAAKAERLFQAFQRLHASADFEGTGVGLATVKRVVARHGGRVWAEGEPGRGATFYFTL